MEDASRQATESSLADLRQELQTEIDSLCKICDMEFTAGIDLQEKPSDGLSSAKRRRMDARWKRRKWRKTENKPRKEKSEGEEGRNGEAEEMEEDGMAEGEKEDEMAEGEKEVAMAEQGGMVE